MEDHLCLGLKELRDRFNPDRVRYLAQEEHYLWIEIYKNGWVKPVHYILNCLTGKTTRVL